jgi:hypothetical protein
MQKGLPVPVPLYPLDEALPSTGNVTAKVLEPKLLCHKQKKPRIGATNQRFWRAKVANSCKKRNNLYVL